ncbi:MAG: FAD-dependent thymidylate synthase [Defluviitaleaceae bacterium]|nr:FAD-dependent thymidylate synthase [Defluviitaleaceae bacterium]
MKVYLNEISGIADAIVSMYMSKRSWSRAFEEEVNAVCHMVLDEKGTLKPPSKLAGLEKESANFEEWMDKLVKWGWKHTTLLRYVDFSCTIEGMHRGGQDDWDAHAKRYNNRILRSSTRLSSYEYEISDWYKDKIIPTDTALSHLGINTPEKIEINEVAYVKAVNGYIREDLAKEQDVKRGLYMLSIPSNFIFKVDITEWSHVYKERCAKGTAHPEVKECCETIADMLEAAHKQFNRELFEKILN